MFVCFYDMMQQCRKYLSFQKGIIIVRISTQTSILHTPENTFLEVKIAVLIIRCDLILRFDPKCFSLSILDIFYIKVFLILFPFMQN